MGGDCRRLVALPAEITLDQHSPDTILENIIAPYLTEQDIHYVAFIGEIGYVSEM